MSETNSGGWERDEVLSVVAIVFSVISLLVSAGVAIHTLGIEFGVNLALTALPNEYSSEYSSIHVVSAARHKDTGARIKEIAGWYRLRISNDSNRAVTIASLKYRVDEESAYDVPMPVLGSVAFRDGNILLSGPNELPMRLEANEAIEFYALLPYPVPTVIGKALLASMWNESEVDTVIEELLSDPEFIEKAEERFPEVFAQDPMSEFVEITEFEIGEITRYQREILSYEGGEVIFLDAAGESIDGFVHQDAFLLQGIISNVLSDMGISLVEAHTPPFETYTVSITTIGGETAELTFTPGSTVFQRLQVQR